MERGHFWEITYEKEDWSPATRQLDRLEGLTGVENTSFVAGNETDGIKIHLKDKTFLKCDFLVTISVGSFTNCTFKLCKFTKSYWTKVKFSNCTFEYCHFSHITFTECDFLSSCRFVENSASGELLAMKGTAISASAFLGSLVTNTDSLPEGVTENYQNHRLVGTKEKLAQVIYSSTKDSSNLDFFFQAYKEMLMASIKQKIESKRYVIRERGRHPVKRNPLVFFVSTFPNRLELMLSFLFGWLTNWGQSILRATFFFVVVFGVFSAL